MAWSFALLSSLSKGSNLRYLIKEPIILNLGDKSIRIFFSDSSNILYKEKGNTNFLEEKDNEFVKKNTAFNVMVKTTRYK